MQKLKQQQLFDRIFERLPDHVTLLLIIISGFLLARLTWMMFPSDPSLIAPLVNEQESQGVSVIKAHAKSTDLGREIAGYHLLGVYKPPPKVVAAPKPPPPKPAAPKPVAKKPRPALQLVGVYALSGKSGIAIINVKGKQEVIGLGEDIGDSGAKLVKVYADHVDIAWDDEAATLSMPGIDKSAKAAIQLPASQQPQAQVQQQIQPVVQKASLKAQSQKAAQGKSSGGAVSSGSGLSFGGSGPSGNVTSVGGVQPSNNQGITPSVKGNSTQKAPVPAGSSLGKATPKLADFRQEIINNNINLLKVIRPSPKKENGKLIGFRIRPGSNRALFKQTGLRSGDIVTAVNGMPLNSNASSMQAMQTLTNGSGAALTVLRGGQPTTVQLTF